MFFDKIPRPHLGPAFQTDEELMGRVRTIWGVSLGVVIVYAVFVTARYMVQPLGDLSFLITGAAVVFSVVSLTLSYTKRFVLIAPHFLIFSFFAIVFSAALTNGGLKAPAVPVFMAIPMAAGVLISLRAALIYFAITCILLTAIFYLWLNGYMRNADLVGETNFATARYVVYLGIGCVIVALVFVQNTTLNIVGKMRDERRNLEKKLAEAETVKSMIVTYNHQINNPLFIATANIDLLSRGGVDKKGSERIETIQRALDRVQAVVEKIGNLEAVSNIERERYLRKQDMIKIDNEQSQ